MFRSSSFNVFLEPTDEDLTKIFNTAVKKSFLFRVPWDEVLWVANRDTDLGRKLHETGLITRAKDYTQE